MKKQCLVLILLMALSVATFAGIARTNGYPVTSSPSTNPKIISWVGSGLSGGYVSYLGLMTVPQFLAAYRVSQTLTPTTITIYGLDLFLTPIEASATIPVGTGTQIPYIFNDTQSNTPVAFAQIINVTQQGGTDNEEFEIYTHPEATIGSTLGAPPMMEYLGMYESGDIYLPGLYGSDPKAYQVTVAPNVQYSYLTYPFEPRHPEPIEIIVNWADQSNGFGITGDRYPQTNEVPITGQQGPGTTLTIQGMDAKGNPISRTVNIVTGATFVAVNAGSVWSTICTVSGGSGSYYLFTNPQPETPLFYYTLLIDHVSIAPWSYDVLANPSDPTGIVNVTVALRDIDDNVIYAADYGKIAGTQIPNQIVVNFFTSAGTIRPSTNVTIPEFSAIAVANLTADTNPRTINVTAVAYVPACTNTAPAHPSFTLFAWTQVTEDGVSSVNKYVWGDWPIDPMLWGYTNSCGGTFIFNDPPKPYLPLALGGPSADGIKLDGPIYEVSIPLWTGCNLVSSPVSPLLNGNYYANYPTTVTETGVPIPAYPAITSGGIPMDLLFSKTDAVGTIEAVWWYDSSASTWHVYIPGISADPSATFKDGVGYWIKADQPCTLEISGVWLENGPFTPPTYSLKGNSWSLVGVTSLVGIQTSQYLESTMGSTGIEAAGPEWLYVAPSDAYLGHTAQGWIRDPSMVWPGQAFWVYNKVPTPINIAP